jgi:RNA polymerase sigma-70 factor, ECF subfamily
LVRDNQGMSEHLQGQEAINAIREGNKLAFQQVFEGCYESLCQYAFTILRDPAEAEDTVQAMFVKVWERRTELDIRQSIRSYLFRAVYNQCMNQLSHRAVRRKHVDDHQAMADIDTQHPEVFMSELDENIRKAIELLPAQCKTIFIMSRYEELRHPEIAQKLNISVNTVQNQICKALKVLREELKDII